MKIININKGYFYIINVIIIIKVIITIVCYYVYWKKFSNYILQN